VENAGFFVLQKGTIENYYQFADPNCADKIRAASNQADSLINTDLTVDVIEESYAGIVRALKHAGRTAAKDELSEVAQIVLQVAAPALLILNDDTTDADLNALNEDKAGRRSKLLTIRVCSSSNDTPASEVDLDSNILDIEGFPLKFQKGCNPVDVVQQLGQV